METDGLLIRRRRIELGHGMNRFAALAGISGAALSRIENGQRQPRPETLKKITDALGCQIHEVAAETNGTASGVQPEPSAGNDEATRGPAGSPLSSKSAPTAK
ncbi:helix-turn-helix domain-containing protein [Streptomyces sp. NPDC059477]|uniref:helix-turn-helix domain-containing protein n=1 Tax=Streptomyces sp. NPDC059477 TaxID=3346847 RepID=UPI0036864E23